MKPKNSKTNDPLRALLGHLNPLTNVVVPAYKSIVSYHRYFDGTTNSNIMHILWT